MRAPRRLAAFAALSFRSTTAFQSPWIVHRTFRAGIGSTTRAVSVASDVTENTASEQRVWLDSAAADNSIDIYEVTSKSFDMVRFGRAFCQLKDSRSHYQSYFSVSYRDDYHLIYRAG